MLISVIITTYNRSDALQMVLRSLNEQTDVNFEVIIADDGSRPETADKINALASEMLFEWQHIWQEDNGFRAARIRNKAVVASQGDYLIFIDGDCLVRRDFIRRHRRLAESGRFVASNRIMLNEMFTQMVLYEEIPIYRWSIFQWITIKHKGLCNRCYPLLALPMGFLRKIQPKRWRGAKACNLAVWRHDFERINGFDEAFEGWGYEDSDLVIRLIRFGIFHKNGRFATTVIHLWHKENDRQNELNNLKRLQKVIDVAPVEAERGLNTL